MWIHSQTCLLNIAAHFTGPKNCASFQVCFRLSLVDPNKWIDLNRTDKWNNWHLLYSIKFYRFLVWKKKKLLINWCYETGCYHWTTNWVWDNLSHHIATHMWNLDVANDLHGKPRLRFRYLLTVDYEEIWQAYRKRAIKYFS